jgi:ParB/RepB/Spo0J family partition protein
MNTLKSPIKIIELNHIKEHPLNHEIFNNIAEEKKEALKNSIKENGLINPLTVMAYQKGRKTDYYVVSGHNRLSALKECGYKEAPCRIIFPVKQGQDLDILISDNLLQRDLSVVEKAKAIFYMNHGLKLSNEEIMDKLGISLRFVQSSLQLMRLLNQLDEEGKKSALSNLEKIKGINRAVQLAKKIVYGKIKKERQYTTKDDIIRFLREELEKKDKEIKKLSRAIKKKDLEIASLNTKLELCNDKQ